MATMTKADNTTPRHTRLQASPLLSKCSGYAPHFPAQRQQHRQNPASGMSKANKIPHIDAVTTPMYCSNNSSQWSSNNLGSCKG